MSKIDRILNQGLWNLHNNKHHSGLDYLSRIEVKKTAWYFWLSGVKGVYEIGEKKIEEIKGTEYSHFYLKYYPDREEKCLDEYSCAEQYLRMSDFFEQEDITLADDFELCPCCGSNECDHEYEHARHLVKRNKGIPKMIGRESLSERLYVIGEIIFQVESDEKLKAVTLKTANELREYAADGIEIKDEQGNRKKLVEKNGLDRAVKGFAISKVFYDFLLEKVLGWPIKTKNIRKEKEGTVTYNQGNKILKKEASKDIKNIVIVTFRGREE